MIINVHENAQPQLQIIVQMFTVPGIHLLLGFSVYQGDLGPAEYEI